MHLSRPVALVATATLISGALAAPSLSRIAAAVQPVSHASVTTPRLSQQQEIALLRQKVKYVFVLYQENRSFDSYFGTYPGADGIYSQPPSQTPGFYQPITNTDGTVSTIQPFRLGPAQYAADTDDIDHSHALTDAKMHVVNGVPGMDRFAQVEEAKYLAQVKTGKATLLEAKQFGELAMAHEDCDTIPLLWNYAHRFTLYDHIFEQMTGPSTPGNLSIIAAQSGQTQWVLHPNQAYKGNGNAGAGVPVLNDNDPFWGSPKDKTRHPAPVNPTEFTGPITSQYGVQINQTYATLPLSFGGKDARRIAAYDAFSLSDLGDVHQDIADLATLGQAAVPWGWYQEGYTREPTDPNQGPTDASGTHASYITHHNGPQYFGYVMNNPVERAHLHGLQDAFTAVSRRTLAGGVYYVKGGYQNIMGMKPADPNAKVQKNFVGDDDHPGYSDAQISEAMVASFINRLAASPYWSQSAVILTWDDAEGDYDHVRPPVRDFGPDGSVITDGPRVPFILISPYSRTGYISHEPGDHASVVKFVDEVFGLTPLALLPDELRARQTGERVYHQGNLGPSDALTSGIGDLLSGFDPARLAGQTAPLSAAYVTVPQTLISTLPGVSGYGCRQLGIVPTDRGLPNARPLDANPRPRTNPTVAKG